MARTFFLLFTAILLVGMAWYLLEDKKIVEQDNLPTELATSYSNWVLYTPQTNSFTVKFPSQPQKASLKLQDPLTGQNKHMATYASPEVNGKLYMVNVVSFMPDEKEGDEESVSQLAIQDMVQTHPDNRLKEISEGTFKTQRAWDFAMQNGTTEVIGKAFKSGKKLYILTLTSTTGLPDQEAFNYFVDSFEAN